MTDYQPEAVNPAAQPARLVGLRRWRKSTAIALALAVAVLAQMPVFGQAADAATPTILGSWTVHFTPSHFNGKGVNIRRPATLINGMVIPPGGQFDFVKSAGPFTTANGYVTGAAIVNGEIKPDGVLGGGLCSAATTAFNALVRAGLEVDKRANHHFYITRYPIGLDATIWVTGSRAVANIIFTNDMANNIKIRAFSGRTYVTFQVWGIKDGRKVTWADPKTSNLRLASTNIIYTDDLAAGVKKKSMDNYDGFDVVVGRTVTNSSGLVIHSDLFKSDYARQTGIIYIGRSRHDPVAGTIEAVITPAPWPWQTLPPTPTPSPSPKPTATPAPTATPTSAPTATPTAAPTATPSPAPTAAPTDEPTP